MVPPRITAPAATSATEPVLPTSAITNTHPVVPPASPGTVHILFMFSGPAARADGIPALLQRAGHRVDCMDLVNAQLPDQDIANDATWERVRAKLIAGHYHFLLASPPCRTFSEARHRTPGPPVLRSWKHPYGFPKSRAKEFRLQPHHYEQIRLDNLLGERTSEACTIMDDLQRGWAVEQPHPWLDSVSLFDFKSFRALHKRGAAFITFDQCPYGAPTTKPTKIMSHGPDFSQLARTCDHDQRWHEDQHGNQV